MSERVVKMLEMAGHPATSENEALIAIRAIRAEVTRSGGFKNLLQSSPRPVQTYVPYSQQREEIISLKDVITKRDAHISELEIEITRLRREVATWKSKAETKVKRFLRMNEDGSMSFQEFQLEVIRRLGGGNVTRRWQIEFEEQTGLPRSKFPRFLDNDKVDDPRYVEAIHTLKKAGPIERNDRPWTKAEVQRLRYLTETSKESEKNIALILSEEFGRKITDNCLKRIKDNSRKRVGIFSDDSYGGPIGVRRI